MSKLIHPKRCMFILLQTILISCNQLKKTITFNSYHPIALVKHGNAPSITKLTHGSTICLHHINNDAQKEIILKINIIIN